MRRFLFAVVAATLLSAPAAHAAFPGANGRIAFTRNAGVDEEIWTAAPDGSDQRRLTANGWGDRMPAFSPDGTKIAYVSLEGGAANPEIYVMDADGGNQKRLTTSTGNVDDFDPAWSPDGKKIAFMSKRTLGNPDIWVMNADGTNPVRLTDNGFDDTDPAWSPDGKTIAFVTTRDLVTEIWAMTDTGNDERPLTVTSGMQNQDPSWSPDGTQIAFMRDAGDEEIYTMNADGTNPVNRTATSGTDLAPAFSPAGDRIVFASARRGTFELFTMAANGGGQAPIVSTAPVANNAPDWQPVPKSPDPDPTDTPTPGPSATATPAPGGGGGGGGGGGAVSPLFEGGGPPAATCEKSSVRFGDVEVLASCFKPKGRANVATGRVRVNGLDLVPVGGEIAIDPEKRTITSTQPVRVLAGAIPLLTGRIAWDLSNGRLELPLGAGATMRLIRLTGTATVTTDGLGRFRIAVLPRIDSVFERFAARLGAASGANLRLPAITGDAVLRTENARGLSLEALSLKASSIPIGLLEVRALTLDFEPSAGNWAGTAQLKLPGPPPQVIADATVTVRDGVFQQASLVAGNSLGMYGFGVRLERLALDMRTDPFRFGGELALGAGPSLPGLGQLVRVNGTVNITAGNPAELRVRGATNVGPASGTASYTAVSTGRQDFAGDVSVDFRPDIGVSAGVSGVIQQRLFVLLGNAEARVLNARLRGDGLFSSVGVAACVPLQQSSTKSSGGFRVGFGYRYATKVIDLMAGSCDVAPWSPVPLGGKAGTSARAAQGAPVTAFDLPAALPGMVLEVEGAQAPPRVTIAGPGGVRATTPADPGEARAGDVLFLRDAAARRTYVAVPAPRAGRWTVTPEPGSSPVTSVRRGDGLPAPRVTARVTGRGHRRTLHWSLRAVRGQVVRLSEEGRGAAATIATARKPRGSVRFRPADGPAGRRSIVAVVEQAGAPRTRLVAGRYAAPAPERPARPKGLALRRRGSTLQIRWRRAAGATAYRVRAELSDGRRLLLTVRGGSLRLPAFGPRESAKVSVTGVRGPYAGPAASKRIRRAPR